MIVMLSLWRNDAARRLHARAEHLMSKTAKGHDVRWLWAVGDSDDATEAQLRHIADLDRRVTVRRFDSGIEGSDIRSTRRRAAWTATQLFAAIREDDTFACLHESDLLSPPDVLDRFLANAMPVAGWPTILLAKDPQFYDIWAFRTVKGQHFDAHMPRPTAPVQVGSFGSCWMAPASAVRNRVLGKDCVVDLCAQWRDEGTTLWADPTIGVVQPRDLWEAPR